MQVVVRFFASFRDIVGSDELRLRIEEGAPVSSLLDLIYAKHPRLKPFEASMLLAVNEEFVDPSTAVYGGDEVAIMPPVSGGRP